MTTKKLARQGSKLRKEKAGSRHTSRKHHGLAGSAHLIERTIKSFDDTLIALQSQGKSALPLICCNGLGVSTFFWTFFKQHFAPQTQVVTWDYRGHGASGLPKDSKHFTMQALVQDTKSVFDNLHLKKGVLVGHSLGAQMILEFYRQHPQRVSGLILCFGTDGQPMNTFYNTRLSRHLFKACYKIGQKFPNSSNAISRFLLQNPLSFHLGGVFKIMNKAMINKDYVERYIEGILRMNPIFFTELLKSAQDHSAQDILTEIKVPTLIIAGEHDFFTPMWISKKMHRLIPNSELFIVKKGSHAALVEQPELINLRIEKFIRERITPLKARSTTRRAA